MSGISIVSDTLTLAEQLIALPSVTPDDAGCLPLIASHLEPLGFHCERMDSGPDDFRVSNLWALRMGSQGEAGKTLADGVAEVREAVMSHLSDHEMGWLLQATAAI